MDAYDHKKIERKWQEKWETDGINRQEIDPKKEKCYVLDMFPYPSGEGLHVGHPKGYIATDIYSRYQRMKGKAILHPMGWDAFGLPAENYALKNKVHPRVAVEKNIARFKEQLGLMGLNYDWSREINTTDPDYYKWTQWIFLQMFKKGLAYESNEPINWCPSCQTGLANEDLEKGKCERCGSQVVKKRIRQWVLKITDYADRLLEDLEGLNWPDNIKEQQRQWIGRSEGLIFKARVKDMKLELETFSAHFEACYADTFVVMAPDHALLDDLITGVAGEKEIREKIEEINIKRLKDKYATDELEGVFTGRFLDDPLGNGHLPIWVANFAMSDYGTGIIKCSAHDPRDFAFAKKYNIPIKVVLVPPDPVEKEKVMNFEYCYSDMRNGILLEPLNLSGKTGSELRDLIAEYVVDNGWARRKTMYRLRDWVFSRQRYWGEPIPLIHCQGKGGPPAPECGVVAVPEKDLPVKLPEVEHYEPTGTGESPLAAISEWVNVKCPKCGGSGKRETNTMPQWAGSSWYYIAYCIRENSKFEFRNSNLGNYWLPADMYVGGAEHATRHLIYARFWHKFLFDIGVVAGKEPFVQLKSVGLILAADGRKMSKRYGNVVNPDDVIERWGADTFRMYEMFLGPFSDAASWNDAAIIGPRRFLERVWRLVSQNANRKTQNLNSNFKIGKYVEKISTDIESFKFNTAVSGLMILLRELEKADASTADIETFFKLLAPFAPHISEELWSELGHTESIHLSQWPVLDQNATGILSNENTVLELPVQVNGRIRTSIFVSNISTEDDVRKVALESPQIASWLSGKEVKKFIYKQGKIISILT